MAHVAVKEAEEILDTSYPVLDHGFVRLVDYLGGDARIVQAARVSYGPGTKSVRDDTRLINYLMKHGHTSPFEQVVLTFHVKAPIFVMRQWARHRTARTNEISGRYSVLPEEFYMPDGLRLQSADNKQGSLDQILPPEESDRLVEQMDSSRQEMYKLYQDMLDKGVAREIARTVLPISLYTEIYWQIDLHNLFHFLRQRLDRHAQYEIREYARVMADIAKKVAPIAWDAFEEHVLYAKTLSRSELEE